MRRNKEFWTRCCLAVLGVFVIYFIFYSLNSTKIKLNTSNLPQYGYRESLGELMEMRNGKVMIEVGVKQGEFAEKILDKWPSFEHYYGVDPWIQQKNYIDPANVDNNIQNEFYQQAKKRLSKFGDNRITLIREFSTKATAYFQGKQIDFIYIDARHDYCAVMEDLNAYYPILACNGIMAGHDYVTATDDKNNIVNDGLTVCPDGSKEIKNGGGVKGFKNIFLFNILTLCISLF